MAKHEYRRPHLLHLLHGQLVAAGVVFDHLEGDGTIARIFAPDSTPKATIDAVLAAHDAAALEAAEVERKRQEEEIRRTVFASAVAAVGKRIDVLTVAERNALIAVLLWRWGALSPTLTILPLEQWAYRVVPDRARPSASFLFTPAPLDWTSAAGEDDRGEGGAADPAGARRGTAD